LALKLDVTSTNPTPERVECSIAGIIDRVEALETEVPSMDQDKLLNDTHENGHDEEDEVEDEEPFNPPPRRHHHDDQWVHQECPRPPRRPNWHGMGGHTHHGPNQQQACGNDDPFTKVKFMIPPFYGLYDVEAYLDWDMTVDNKFTLHLIPQQHRVR
jgi:hypothetical protein